MTWDYSVSINIWVLLILAIAAVIGCAGGFWAVLDRVFAGFMDS